ncbi:MAG: hypothetical protein ACOCU4_04810 [Alkalispirochaeta sp.]
MRLPPAAYRQPTSRQNAIVAVFRKISPPSGRFAVALRAAEGGITLAFFYWSEFFLFMGSTTVHVPDEMLKRIDAIAAVAVSHGAEVVTADLNHFSRIATLTSRQW